MRVLVCEKHFCSWLALQDPDVSENTGCPAYISVRLIHWAINCSLSHLFRITSEYSQSCKEAVRLLVRTPLQKRVYHVKQRKKQQYGEICDLGRRYTSKERRLKEDKPLTFAASVPSVMNHAAPLLSQSAVKSAE